MTLESWTCDRTHWFNLWDLNENSSMFSCNIVLWVEICLIHCVVAHHAFSCVFSARYFYGFWVRHSKTGTPHFWDRFAVLSQITNLSWLLSSEFKSPLSHQSVLVPVISWRPSFGNVLQKIDMKFHGPRTNDLIDLCVEMCWCWRRRKCWWSDSIGNDDSRIDIDEIYDDANRQRDFGSETISNSVTNVIHKCLKTHDLKPTDDILNLLSRLSKHVEAEINVI